MKIKVVILIVFINLTALIADSTTAKHPIPSNFKYPYGFIPTTLNSDWLKSEYDRWVKSALTTCNSTELYVSTDNGGKVEAVGFGALIFAYMGDKAKFDGIYNFYKKNCNSGAGGMMGWIGQCGGNNNGSATDGDIDVAFGLIIASWQWPDGGYREKAKEVIKNLKSVVVKCGENTNALAMGYNFGGCTQTDMSYYNPAAFREFAKVIDNAADSAMWVKLADDTYSILEAGADKTTGLVADRQSYNGSPSGSYAFDACRTPWRITLDYLWNGNERAKAWCKKLSDWAYKFGIKNIKENFSLSGQSGGGAHSMAYTGGFAIAAMANSQAMVDEFGTDMKTIHDTYWFTFALTPCYLITFTGNQWRPDLFGSKTSKQYDKSNCAANYLTIRKHLAGQNLSIEGLQPGYSVMITSLSGKRLFYETTANGKMCIDIPFMQSGCTVISVLDKAKNIVKRSAVPILR